MTDNIAYQAMKALEALNKDYVRRLETIRDTMQSAMDRLDGDPDHASRLLFDAWGSLAQLLLVMKGESSL